MALLPVPVMIDGVPEPVNHRGYWPGDPLPPQVYVDGDPRRYIYSREQDAFTPAPPLPTPPEPISFGDILGLLVYAIFFVGFAVVAVAFLWWLIIPAAAIFGLVKLFGR